MSNTSKITSMPFPLRASSLFLLGSDNSSDTLSMRKRNLPFLMISANYMLDLFSWFRKFITCLDGDQNRKNILRKKEKNCVLNLKMLKLNDDWRYYSKYSKLHNFMILITRNYKLFKFLNLIFILKHINLHFSLFLKFIKMGSSQTNIIESLSNNGED